EGVALGPYYFETINKYADSGAGRGGSGCPLREMLELGLQDKIMIRLEAPEGQASRSALA
ncbi:MAG TPA: hypothetical protein VLT56_05395, partial [Desulfobacterales bacterium]|nr:hypothetical protein [Desulfobacterales bacterium]